MNKQFTQPKNIVNVEGNKQSVARDFDVKHSEVTYAIPGTVLDGYKVIYDKSSQRAYALPANIFAGSTITSLTNGVLVTSVATYDLGILAVQREEWAKITANFTSGFTLYVPNEVVLFDGNLYRWGGSFPKEVAADSTPDSTGGINSDNWISFNDSKIKEALKSPIPDLYNPSPRQNMIDIYEASQDSIRIMTFNTWNVGSTPNYGMVNSTQKIQDIQEATLRAKVDFCGYQEWYQSPFFPASQLAIFPLVNSYFGMMDPTEGRRTVNDYDGGIACVTDGTITASSTVIFSGDAGTVDLSPRGYIRVVVTIKGQSVVFYVTHLSTETVRNNVEFNLLATALGAETNPRVVLLGDFNADAAEKIKQITDRGFTSYNNRDVNTNNTGGSWFIDNIYTKGFGALVERGALTLDTKISDHKPFFIEVKMS